MARVERRNTGLNRHGGVRVTYKNGANGLTCASKLISIVPRRMVLMIRTRNIWRSWLLCWVGRVTGEFSRSQRRRPLPRLHSSLPQEGLLRDVQ